MTLKKYLLYVKFWLVLFPYLVVGLLYRTHPTRLINQEYYFLLYCLLFGFACGLIFIGITELYDWYPFEPLILSTDEEILFSNNEIIIDIEEKKLRDQKEIKSAKKSLCVWLVAATVFYSILFFTVTSN